MLSSAEIAIYRPVRVGTVGCDVPRCPAFVAGNVWAAMALMPRLLAGPAGQPLVLVALLRGSDVSLFIYIFTAQVRRLSELTEVSLIGRSVHRDGLAWGSSLLLAKFPLARRPVHRNKLILRLLP